jgi:hypothetical protein
MGSGDIALFGVPDWSTLNASTLMQPEISGGNPFLTTMRTQNDANNWVNFPAPGYASGTHRLRMTFDPAAKTMVYAMDMNYAGGPFVADITAPTVDLNHIDCPSGCGNPAQPISADFFAPDGWPTEPSRIYFGGDDEVTYKDFSVTVSALPNVPGDYNGNRVVDAADYTIWRDHLGQTGATAAQGDGTGDGSVTVADFDYWKLRFGNTSGSGGGIVQGGVPEPSSMLLVVIGLVSWVLGEQALKHRRSTQ